MIETGLGEALEKLIEVLQLEGHELFRIFVEVQAALAIRNLIFTIVSIVGLIVGFKIGYKLAARLDWIVDDGDEIPESVFMGIFVGIGLMFIALILSLSIASVYMRSVYPEYYAAKELILQMSYLVP